MPTGDVLTASQIRLREALADAVRAAIERSPDITTHFAARVASVTPGGALGGTSALAQITIGTVVVPAAYVASYTPVVNDPVVVARTGSTLVILGRIQGTPP